MVFNYGIFYEYYWIICIFPGMNNQRAITGIHCINLLYWSEISEWKLFDNIALMIFNPRLFYLNHSGYIYRIKAN